MHAGALIALLLGTLLAACSGSTGPAGPAGAAGRDRTCGSDGTRSGRRRAQCHHGHRHHRHHHERRDQRPAGGEVRAGGSERRAPKRIAGGRPGLGDRAARAGPKRHRRASGIPTSTQPSRRRAARPAWPPATRRPRRRPTVESATSGTLVDNGDGTYQYTFKTDITKVPNVIYDAALTHRVAFEIRGLAQANNAAYTFQPSTGATTGIFSREIVETRHLRQLPHDAERARRRPRRGAVLRDVPQPGHHRPVQRQHARLQGDGPQDPHRQHAAEHPDARAARTPRRPWGSATGSSATWQSLNNFNTAALPAGHAQLHDLPCAESSRLRPRRPTISTVPTAEACGACHDNVNFATGANHSSEHRRQ